MKWKREPLKKHYSFEGRILKSEFVFHLKISDNFVKFP